MTETPENRRINILALGIFVLALIYRTLLLQTDVYPPGPDAGLHNSIINSMVIKNGNFLWNYYHMGGGPSLTHPGFHIFTAFIWLVTGMPDYMAQCTVAVLFSSLIVLCTFLLTKATWGLPLASLTAAFLAVLSRYDIEMIAWGGYPNVVTLALIPLLFYMYFRKDTPLKTTLAVSSLLVGSLFVTHSLSALTFLSIAVPFLAFSFLISRKSSRNKKLLVFTASIALGVLLASPFIVHIFPVYMENVERGMFTGAVNENRRAIILTRMIPLQLVFAALVPTFSFLLFSKKYKGSLFDNVGVLYSLWMVVPALLTQSFIIGLYTDYFRFLHFLIFPLTIFFALLIDHTCGFITGVANAYAQVKKIRFNPKIVYTLSTLVLLAVFIFGFVPFFSSPSHGFIIADYYRVVYPQEFELIEWIKQRTSEGAIFVSNHGYGWWIAGFGQRITLTSTDPQFLIIPHEFEAAYIAKTLLKTNFVLNNGFIEVCEDGGYFGRYNPMLSINCSKSLEPYPMLSFNESEITIFYTKDSDTKMIGATAIPLKGLTVEQNQESANITITRENNHLTFVRQIKVFKSAKFATLSLTIKGLDRDHVSLQYVRLILRAHGKVFKLEDTIGFLDENAKICAQVIFEGKKPIIKQFTEDNPKCIEVLYNAENSEKAEIKMAVGGFEMEEIKEENLKTLFASMTQSWFQKEPKSFPIKIFDYREVIKIKRINFIACQRRGYSIERFANDPMFDLVYINDNVALFKIREQHD